MTNVGGKLGSLVAYTIRGAYDELYTPFEAIDMLIPYIPSWVNTVWECTSSEGRGNISTSLRDSGFDVVESHIENGKSFFEYEPSAYDIIITNPPYKYKNQFLKRAFELGKPFAFLLPITSLEGKGRGAMFAKYGVQVIIPNKRFNFKPEKGSSAWFQTSWFTCGFGLPNDLVFVDLTAEE